MKSILHIVALIAVIAAAFFGYNTKTRYTEQIAVTTDYTGKNKNIDIQLEKSKEEEDSETEIRTAALSLLNETKDSLDLAKSQHSSKQKTLAQVETDIENSQSELNKVEAAINKLGEQFEGITLAEVPEKIASLEDKKKNMQNQLEDLELALEKLKQNVAKNKEDITREDRLLAESKARVRGNDFEASVIAVNNDWGFAVVSAGAKSGLKGDTRLLLKRGGRLIGKMLVASLEDNQAVLEPVPGSLSPGVLIQRGDRVILAEPVEN